MVKVVAHRGFSGKYPENTAVAFQEALALDVDMVEFDVRLCRDGVPVVMHDATVDRTSDGCGRIGQMTLAEIKALDAGGWLAEPFGGERVLTLYEALDLLGHKVGLNVHVKAGDEDRAEVIRMTVAALAERDLLETAFIASDQASVIFAKDILPELAVCNLSTTPKETYIGRSLSFGCEILQPGNAQVDAEFVQEAHRHDLEVNPFYADDEAEMRRLIACGVDGILTNHPDRLLALRQTL